MEDPINRIRNILGDITERTPAPEKLREIAADLSRLADELREIADDEDDDSTELN